MNPMKFPPNDKPVTSRLQSRRSSNDSTASSSSRSSTSTAKVSNRDQTKNYQMILGNPNQNRLASAQANAFLNIWGRLNHESREFLTHLLRMLALHCGDPRTRYHLFVVIQVMLYDGNDSVEHAMAAEEFLNVMFSLPLGSFCLMSALAVGQPNPPDDQRGEGQVQEQVGNHQNAQENPGTGSAYDSDESSNTSLHLGSSGNTPVSETASMTGITSMSETTVLSGNTSMPEIAITSEISNMSFDNDSDIH